MLELTRDFLFLFGVLTIAGGVMGFVKAQSRASLIAGGVSGVLLLVAGYLIGLHTMAGLILGLVVSLALAGRFVPAFLKTKKPMPGGLLSLLSVIGVILTVISLLS